MTADDLRAAMNVLDDRCEAGEITWQERLAAYPPLNDAYRALTGHYYTSGRFVIEPVHTSVHHNRARSHGRVR